MGSQKHDLATEQQQEKKRVNDSNTVIVGDFNNPHTHMDISPRQKISKETQAFNDKLAQTDQVDIYRTFHPKPKEFTFFSSIHETYLKVGHILGRRPILGF